MEFDYQANEPDELSLVKGAILTNIIIQKGGWWEGTLGKAICCNYLNFSL